MTIRAIAPIIPSCRCPHIMMFTLGTGAASNINLMVPKAGGPPHYSQKRLALAIRQDVADIMKTYAVSGILPLHEANEGTENFKHLGDIDLEHGISYVLTNNLRAGRRIFCQQLPKLGMGACLQSCLCAGWRGSTSSVDSWL